MEMGEKMKEKSSGTHCKGTAIPAGKIPFSWALGQVFSNIQHFGIVGRKSWNCPGSPKLNFMNLS